MIEQLTRKDFAGLAEGSLAIEHEGARLPMRVAELQDLPATPTRPEPFSMVLEGPSDPFLKQGIRKVVHPSLGVIELFMVPIARTREHAKYELIFN